MQKYLLILFSYAGLEEIKDYLLKELKKDDKLYLRALMLEQVPKLSEHLISEIGFLGEKVVNDVEGSVVEIYKNNAKKFLEEIALSMNKNSINLDKELVEKDQLKKLKKAYNEIKADKIIINFSQNEFVSDQAKENNLKRWLKNLKVKKDIFYDGKKQ